MPRPENASSDCLGPLWPDRVYLGFIGDQALLANWNRAKELVRIKRPSADADDVLRRLLDFFLWKNDPRRRIVRERALRRPAAGRLPENDSRRIPQGIKDEVWLRDGGRCAHRLPDGVRCAERAGLEFDHIVPWALGGPSRDARNIRLLCRGHNRLRARRCP